MSDTQKLTPALSTPGRDLLRREIYKGLADRAAGRVKDLDVDAILAKGKQLFQKRCPLASRRRRLSLPPLEVTPQQPQFCSSDRRAASR